MSLRGFHANSKLWWRSLRSDACKLAGTLRSGDLTAVWVPDEEQGAMRDLTRARDDLKPQ